MKTATAIRTARLSRMPDVRDRSLAAAQHRKKSQGQLRSVGMVVRYELLSGRARLNATTVVLQRARLADPLGGMWEAADVQWWWRRTRPTDELALPVWFDEVGPVAAAGLTAWEDTWQADVFAVPSVVREEEVWACLLYTSDAADE